MTSRVIQFLTGIIAIIQINHCYAYNSVSFPDSMDAYKIDAITDFDGIESDKLYTISSDDDFAVFYGKLCDGNTFAGFTVMLTKDVSFDTGGKTGERNFEGVFNGNGYRINDVRASIFTNNKGEIRNLHIASGTLNNSGSFCVNNYGCIVGCKNSANINVSSSSNEGIRASAICSSNYGDIINCINEGNVTLELIAIYGSWSKAVTSCGGICAYSGAGSSIVYCTNNGTISNSGIYSAVTGGIVATAEYCSIVGCENNGLVHSYLLNSSPSKGTTTVQSYQLQHVGGIAGHVLYSVINRCSNFGAVESNFQYLGGIAGYVGNSDVYNLENFGNLDGYEGYGFHSVSGIIPYFKNPYKRQNFLNCINHGNISVFAKYGVATGAGISAEIENAYIANCYSTGAISCTNTGNMSDSFRFPQYKFENSEELNNGINNVIDANAFISTYDSPETLLKWIDSTDGVTLSSDYFAHPVALHGSCNIYVYPENLDEHYSLKIWAKDDIGTETVAAESRSPIEVRGLRPETDYSFEVYSKANGQLLDNGVFKTLKPNIDLITFSVGYDNVVFRQLCDAKGADEVETYVLFGENEQQLKRIEVADTVVSVGGLDEETNYMAELVYTINKKEYRSDKVQVSTNAIVPQFSLLSATPYSLTLKCENIDDLKDFNPELYVESPMLYDIGGAKTGESKVYKLDSNGTVSIDGLYYGYSPEIFSKYTILGEERFRRAETFATLNWGGEGIIQLSPNAAMVHGLFGGMGQHVPNGGYTYKYDRARFYYRDATSSDESYVESACIDGGVDYAATIPMDNFLYQYYISLQYSRYTDPKNQAKDGEWQIIDARKPTVDIVEPRFYNLRYENKKLSCSCIEGEESITEKLLQYKVEGTESYNVISLSKKSGTEQLSRTMSSIVPQLTYLIKMACNTVNGKTYYSPIYRLYDGVLELATDMNEEASLDGVKIDDFNVRIFNNQIIIEGKNDDVVVSVYNVYGVHVYEGTENIIQVPLKGVYIVKIGDKALKVLI